MSRSRAKLLVGGSVILVAVGFLAFAGVREGWVYYLPVDEFVAEQAVQDRRVRLHGTVSGEGLEMNATMLTAKFDLRGEVSSLRVEYTGVVPDMFQAERDVVVEGELGEDGVFKADVLLTKCASKYEAEDSPHAEGETEVGAEL